MPIEIIVPRLGWSMEEGAFVAWLKKDGEFVRAGEPLFSIEGDKAIQEIESIDSGTLRIAANGPQPGQAIRVGDVLGHLISDGESASALPSTAGVASEPATSPPSPLLPAVPLIDETRLAVQAMGLPAISPRVLRVASELGVDWAKVIGSGRTGRIRERDIRAASGAITSSDRPGGRG